MDAPPLPLAEPPEVLAGAPAWRREPYLLLFPLGALLAWAGVLPWLLFSLGATELYRPMFAAIGYRAAFHPVAQVEGFLTCFAVGFLFTFIPRRTGTAPPSPWQMAVALATPVASVVCAWFERWLLAQISWIALIAVLVGFVVRRARHGSRRILPSFVWLAAGLLMGAAGAVLAGLGSALDPPRFWLHLVGRGLLLQGLFTGLVLGTFGLLLPAGYLWVAVAPEYRRAGLHLVFLGCFTALVLAVSTQVGLSHGDRPGPLRGRPWQLVASCALLVAALVARVLLEVDPPHFHLWLGASAAAFLSATVPWAALALARRS